MEGFTELPGSNGNVLKKITRDGSGNGPSSGADVTVDYKGYFKDGKVFDQSRRKKKSKPFVFKLGVGEVIRGWDVGVASMKKGEKATFYIKSEYAYGSSGAGDDIPPNSDLLFDVELINF
jgi:FKBP-type peptidyl-prolyl cis-trans isomerase